jgi:lysozyme family protein
MSDPFDACLTEVLHHEGGYSDDPRDPGGITMLGVTKRVWEQWTRQNATAATMKALTKADVSPLYRKNYWDAVSGDKLPPALALCVFDFAVNAGPARAARYLQSLVGAAVDGKIGAGTLAAVFKWEQAHGLPQMVKAYQNTRREYYRSLGTFKTFGRGWLRRVDEVEAKALEMAR